jgi:hypothetical protein
LLAARSALDVTARAASPLRQVLRALIAVLFVVTHAAALSHELQHVFHEHDGPCALHEAAEHLVAVAPVDPAPAIGPARGADVPAPALVAGPERPTLSRDARAPPIPF